MSTYVLTIALKLLPSVFSITKNRRKSNKMYRNVDSYCSLSFLFQFPLAETSSESFTYIFGIFVWRLGVTLFPFAKFNPMWWMPPGVQRVRLSRSAGTIRSSSRRRSRSGGSASHPSLCQAGTAPSHARTRNYRPLFWILNLPVLFRNDWRFKTICSCFFFCHA